MVGVVLILVVAAVFAVILAVISKSYFTVTTLVVLPFSALAFSIFYGFWSNNDYQLFVPQAVKKVVAGEEAAGKDCPRPRIARDWVTIGLLATNIILLLIYQAIIHYIYFKFGIYFFLLQKYNSLPRQRANHENQLIELILDNFLNMF